MAKKEKKEKKQRGFFGKLFGFLGKFLLWVLIAFFAFSAVGGVVRAVKLDSYRQEIAGYYGTKVDVFGETMNVEITGDGDDVLVLLPGLGEVSPAFTFQDIAKTLSADFKVVVVEPFGYGLSDVSARERTAVNIAEEVHECLSQLGIKKYVLGGHSIAGIWIIEYANMYPDEITAVLALDNSFPTQNEVVGGMGLQMAVERAGRFLNGLGTFQAINLIDDSVCVSAQSNYTKEQQRMAAKIFLVKAANKNVVGECIYFKNDYDHLATLKYPDEIPVFWALCSSNVEQLPIWRDCRAGLSECPSSELHVYEGTHYIFLEQGGAICSDFLTFYKALN